MVEENCRFKRAGRRWPELALNLWQTRKDCNDVEWTSLRNLKASYNAGDDVAEVSWNAYTMYRGDNLLYGGGLYPSLPVLADEVIAKALELLNAPEGAGGTFATGGTESILLGVRAALQHAHQKRNFSSGMPEIVAPSHVHPAFTKAAKMMGIKLIRVPIKDYQADVMAMSDAVTDNTFMLIGSAHAYPLGHVDPIEGIGALAREHDLWMHVDCCLGGFLLPFVVALGNPVPAFDFSVPEVMSISADLHKYGYTARGASLILLRDKMCQQYQGFDFDDWPTGAFNTATFSGSRPGGAVASAWAVMNYLGYDGYLDRTARMLEGKRKIITNVEAISGVQLCGDPEGGIIAFEGEGDHDMFAVRDGMTARGWHTGLVVDPPGFQLLLNYRHGEIADEFSNDLEDVIRLVKRGRIISNGSDRSYGS